MKQVLILGGGFGGVYTAHKLLKKLKPKEAKVTLVNKNNYFLFTPMLHEAATGNIKFNNIVESIRDILKGKNFCFRKDIVKKIDLKKKKVKLGSTDLSYDYLVVALGSQTNFYGLPGRQYCLELKTMEDAHKVRNRVIEKFEEASECKKKNVKKTLTFVVVGGGPTGVELSCELADWIYNEFKDEYKEIDFKDVTIALMQPENKVLRGADEDIRSIANKVMKKKKIKLMMNCTATGVGKDYVMFKEGRKKKKVFADTIIWTAGVRPSDIKIKGIQKERGAIPVDEFLRIKNYKDAFAIGDIASYVNPKDNSRPSPTAQLADKQAKGVAKNILSVLRKKDLQPFIYKSDGFLASLGNLQAVANIRGFKFHGFPAWFVWRSIYLIKLIGIQNKLRVMFDWTLELFFKRDTSQV